GGGRHPVPPPSTCARGWVSKQGAPPAPPILRDARTPIRVCPTYATRALLRIRAEKESPAMPSDTIVDIYCHIFPDKFFEEMNRIAPRLGNIAARLRGVKKLFDLDERFREMAHCGHYRQITSLQNPPIEDLAAGEVGINLARIGNDAMAELTARHPARFPTFVAALSMTDVDGSVKEARRAVNELGAGGVQIFTSVAGRPLDEKAFEPIFATMAELDLPIWLHPARTASMPDYLKEQKSRFEMWWCFGWPYDTSVAMVRMVFCGLLDRY